MASMKDIRKALSEIDLDELEFEYGCIGIRVQEESYGLRVGDVMEHNSRVWIDGEETEEELDGVCAISVSCLDVADEYYGSCILVLGSDRYTYGEDAGEIILQDATVLAVIEL